MIFPRLPSWLTALATVTLATLALSAPLAAADPAHLAPRLPQERTLDKRTLGVGHLNLSRDYLLSLTEAHWAPLVAKSGTTLPGLFAGVWHTACINFANTVDQHHVIDISPEQPNAAEFELYAFCGGQTKVVINGVVNENGTGPVFDNTIAALALKANVILVEAAIIADPLTLEACEAYKAANPGFPVVCG